MSAKSMIARRIQKAVARTTRADLKRKLTRERLRRGRERQFLALQVGTFVLNEVEHGGRMYLENYLSVSPRWILARYEHHRRR